MKVYVAICKDRHVETVAVVCATLDRAIVECKEWVEDDAKRHGLEEDEIGGWLYYVRTGYDEGPEAWVTEQEILT